MTGNVVGELIVVASVLLVGLAHVLLTVYMRPVDVVAKNMFERKSLTKPKKALWMATMLACIASVAYIKQRSDDHPQVWAAAIVFAVLFVVATWGWPRYFYGLVVGTGVIILEDWIVYPTQGMFAAQMLAVILALAGAGKVRQLTIWFAQDGRPRMALASLPLWTTISIIAVLVDTFRFPRTLDAVMAWWQFGIFDNPHIPEGDNAGGGFVHQLYYGEQYVVLGVFTPVVITMFIGAMAVWAKQYGRKVLVRAPACGFAVGLLACVVVTLMTHQTINAAPIMVVCTVVPAAVAASISPYWQLLWRWDQGAWNRDLDHGI